MSVGAGSDLETRKSSALIARLSWATYESTHTAAVSDRAGLGCLGEKKCAPERTRHFSSRPDYSQSARARIHGSGPSEVHLARLFAAPDLVNGRLKLMSANT